MRCPRCDTGALDERERNGVTVDVCPQCRGVWLDRGELEKLLAFAKRDLEDERAYYSQNRPPQPPPPAGHAPGGYPPGAYDPRYDREPPSSDRRGRPGHHGQYRKKSWLENLGDIFD